MALSDRMKKYARASVDPEERKKLHGGEGQKRHKWETGDTKTLRTIPRGSKDDIVIAAQHWHVQKGPIPCPRMAPEPAPCRLCDALWTVHKAKDPRATDLFKSFRANEFCECVAINRADGEVLPLSGNINPKEPGVGNKILNATTERKPDGELIALEGEDYPYHVKTGFDMIITKGAERFDFELARRPSPLAATPEAIAALIAQAEAFDLESGLTPTPEQVSLLNRLADDILSGKARGVGRTEAYFGIGDTGSTPPIEAYPDATTPTAPPVDAVDPLKARADALAKAPAAEPRKTATDTSTVTPTPPPTAAAGGKPKGFMDRVKNLS